MPEDPLRLTHERICSVMQGTEILRAELERLFELEDLKNFTHSVLGFDPDAVGGTAAKASFAGALTAYCHEHDALLSLIHI